MNSQLFSVDAIEAWIAAQVAEALRLDPAAVDRRASFDSVGLGSRELVMLSGDLEEWLGLPLSPVILYEFPTVAALAAHLAVLKRPSGAGQEGWSAGTPERPAGEAIAIVGMATRFPGATDLDAFWEVLRDGRDCITKVPADRWERAAADLPALTPWGGFLADVAGFDAHFFGISPREAVHIDPQQRLLLEVAWEALADAGQDVRRLAGTRAGVYVGISSSEYGQNQLADLEQINSYMGTGSALSVAANRLSYYFNWHGPSLAIDTACSSSLVAVHLACQSLRQGEIPLALVAGANLILGPAITMNFQEAGAMAADGRCKSFDARADGYVRSEGVGAVILKPLSQAIADHDRIYAVIRGSAVNQDGRTNGLMAPNPRAQSEVLREAYERAAVLPSQVTYVETHGTGTLLGDPIEAQSLGELLGPGRPDGSECRIGSVKTNIGHLEAAAGIAGVIKTALALYHHQLPPSLHFQTPNPHIAFDKLRLRVQHRLEPWPAGAELLAGVSSFGFGGTNAHIVLAGSPSREPEPDRTVHDGKRAQLLLLSARTPEALAATVRQYREWLSTGEEATARPGPSLGDIARTATGRRTHLEERLALVASSRAEAVSRLDAFLGDEGDPYLVDGRANSSQTAADPGVVFVCSGQGSQWPGMGRQLWRESAVFRQSMQRTAAAFAGLVDWDLESLLLDEADQVADQPIDVIQPTLFAITVALAELWQSLGIRPQAVLGHSMGEVAAAHIAGILSLDDAARIICRRSRLLRQISGRGAMALAELSPAEAAERLAGYEDRLALAAINGPRAVILAGETEALEELLEELTQEQVFVRRVNVDVASHSPQVDELRSPLLAELGDLQPGPAQIAFYSTVNGEPVAGPELDAGYWMENLRRPVLFAPTVERLIGDNGRSHIFIELSPHPILLPSIGQLPGAGESLVLVPSLRRDSPEWPAMLLALGRLYCAGYAFEWSPEQQDAIFGLAGNFQPVSLPPYPWQHERFWFQPQPAAGHRRRLEGVLEAHRHPLLGQVITQAAGAQTVLFQSELALAALPYLKDHRVQERIVVPAAAYLEMALSAAGHLDRNDQNSGSNGRGNAGDVDRAVILTDVRFDDVLHLPEGESVALQLVLAADLPDQAAFHIASRLFDETGGQTGSWRIHARGRSRRASAPAAEIGSGDPTESLSALQRRLTRPAGEGIYDLLAERQLHYGPAFQGVSQVWVAAGGESLAEGLAEGSVAHEALARLILPEATAGGDQGIPAAHYIQPVLLDAAFQSLAAALPEEVRLATAGQLLLPVALRRLVAVGPDGLAGTAWSYAHFDLDRWRASGELLGDITLFDDQGNTRLKVDGLRLRTLGQPALSPAGQKISRWFYTVNWREKALEAGSDQADQPDLKVPGRWLVFGRADQPIWEALREWLAKSGRQPILVEPLSSSGRPAVGSLNGELADPAHLSRTVSFQQLGPDHFRLNPADANHFRQLMASISNPNQNGSAPCPIIIQGWGIAGNTNDMDQAQTLTTTATLHLVQALAAAGWRTPPRLYLLTSGYAGWPELAGRLEPPLSDLVSATLDGLGRVIQHEHPEWQCTTIDLPPVSALPEQELQQIAASLIQECLAASPERQIALRPPQRLVARLQPFTPAAAELRAARPARHFESEGARLTVGQAGLLDTLALQPYDRPRPGAGQVEIAVEASGLNFLDVLTALGDRPDAGHGPSGLGAECAGRISAVGPGVEGLQIGDAVLAIAGQAFSSHALTEVALTVRRPAALDAVAAATMPIAFATALYALSHVANLQRGERVLIHSAATGTGLAALQIAKALKAEVWATAGSPEKREYLRQLGIEHVFDSRSLDFATEIMSQTNGQGVNVVFNSLSGQAIQASLSVLGRRGRFLEIGKRDVYGSRQIALYALRHNLSLAVIDLAQLVIEEPAFAGQLLQEVMGLYQRGQISPLPVVPYPVAQAKDAFRMMAQARHQGKIVLAFPDGQAAAMPAIRPDGTYLVSGGLGGIGLQVAAFLAERGAGRVALIGRRAPDAPAAAALETLRQAGANIIWSQVDVTDAAQLAIFLNQLRDGGPDLPLRGIFHAAGLLDDGVLLGQEPARFAAVLAPKMAGSWHLHRLSLDEPLDFFVLFSSAAAVVGSPGQGNYAAANAFLNQLARWRQAQGRPAQAISWGPWSEVGLASRPERGGRLSARGFESISPAEGMQALEWALAGIEPELVILPLNLRQWQQSYPQAADWPLFADLADATSGDGQPTGQDRTALRQALLAAPAGRPQHTLLEYHVRQQIAQVLHLAPQRITPTAALGSLGFDSLMALELRNRLESSLGLQLSATMVWNYPTLPALVTFLAGQLGLAGQPDSDGRPPFAADKASPDELNEDSRILNGVAGLSEEDVLRELMGE